MGAIKRSAKPVKLAVQEKSRQDEKRNKSTTTDFDTFDLKSIICKMRIPLLILCLAVIYGTCRAYDEDVNLIEAKAINNGDYKLDYQNVPFERSLSRQKRGISIANIALKLLGLSNPLAKPMLELIPFGLSALCGLKSCNELVEFSTDKLINPLETVTYIIKRVSCPILQLIGKQIGKLITYGLQMAWKFTTRVCLPGLHYGLNKMDDCNLVPPTLKPVVVGFNALYAILKLLGYVS